MMAFLARLRQLVNPRDAFGRPSPARIYLDLRDRMIRTAPGQYGIEPTTTAPRVWGVLLDIGLDTGTATVVALADGSASLYTSGGGGIIGGAGRELVARAAKQLVELADAHLQAFPPAQELPLPRDGRSALVVLTYDGPRRVEDESSALADLGRGAASMVFMAAQDVLTQLRHAEASR